ncbi:MAG: TIGR03751 family conjugal transfer lipoprotein [Hydrogenophaga sp.]
MLGACSVAGPRESPLNEVTAGSPTVSEVYRGQASSATDAKDVRERLHSSSPARSLSKDDARESAYWTPLEPMQQRFSRVPNPDLVMVVFPHLAKGKYPVPGYVTVFPMYEQTHYALPGEIEIEQEQARARFQPSGAPAQRGVRDHADARPGAPR